jgi:hypothetical protein
MLEFIRQELRAETGRSIDRSAKRHLELLKQRRARVCRAAAMFDAAGLPDAWPHDLRQRV